MVRRWLASPPLQPVIQKTLRLLDAPASVTDRRARSQTLLLNGLLAFTSIALFGGVLLDRFVSAHDPIIFITAVLCAAAPLLVRAGYADAVRNTLGIVIAILPPILWVINPIPPQVLAAWNLTCATSAYLLFDRKAMIWVTILSLVASSTAILISPWSPQGLGTLLYLDPLVMLMLYYAATLRDRADRVIEEQARTLEQERQRTTILLEAAQEGIVIHRSGTILLVNPAVKQMFGYSAEEVIGKEISDLVAPESKAEVLRRYHEEIEGPFEAGILHKNGEVLTVELNGRSHFYNGERVRIVTLRDLTARKLEQQRQIELMVEREKVRILQRFISDISHDLRTPLSVINTSIYLIGKLADNPERQRAHTQVLQAQAAHVQRLLEDLISMSRLDKAETGDFHFRLIDLHELLSQSVSDAQNEALRKHQTLTFTPSVDPISIVVDPAQIKRMMRHLIMNGLSYTPEGSIISIATSRAEDSVMISVNDNGPGIAKEVLPHIFEEFYRGDPARGGDGGFGLGLTIARKIARAHGGDIAVSSSLNRGSEFRITLPLHLADRAARTPEQLL
ncbi:MAG: PAS domain S-box protein [Anaerolineae bacterium]|nr:PAS domain S-box protein [Anaerolineae bacterium]